MVKRKEEIVSMVSKDTKYSMAMVETVIDSLLNNITRALSNGDKVQFAGFGAFEPKEYAARIGRNPHTNEEIPIPARVAPSFKAGKYLKNAVMKPIK